MAIDSIITEAFEQSKATIEKPTSPSKTGWSDKVCEQFANKYKFPQKCLEASTQKAILIRYLNFYSAGEVAPGISPFDIIAAMIAIFPREECTSATDTLWSKEYYGESGHLFSVIPEFSIGEEKEQSSISTPVALKVVAEPGALMKLEAEAGVVISELPGSQAYDQTTEKSNPLIYNYSRAISQSFLDSLRKTLDSSEATAAQGKGVIIARRVLGYTALTMVRALVKEPLQMANAFSKAQYRKNLIALLTLSEVFYCPPCSRALQLMEDAFNKQLSRPVYLFSMIVQRWTELTAQQDKKMAAMLGASCLTHTSYNGMAMIHLLIEVVHHYNIEWSQLCKLLYLDVTAESWRRVAIFMKTYQHKDGPQVTQPWARVIDDGYLKEYSGQENFALCTILAASIDDSIDGTGGVWDSRWAKVRQAEIQDLKKLGYAVRRYHSKKLSEVKGLTEEANKLVSLAQKENQTRETAPSAPQPIMLNRSDV